MKEPIYPNGAPSDGEATMTEEGTDEENTIYFDEPEDEPETSGFYDPQSVSGNIEVNSEVYDGTGMPPQPPMSGLRLLNFEALTLIHSAHDKIAAVMKEGSGSLPRAFSSNVARDRQNVKDTIAGGLVGTAAALVGGDPIIFIFAAPFGFVLRNLWNTAKIRMRRDKLSGGDIHEMESTDIPELMNAWDLTCYKFIRLVRGYNARVHAVFRIRENQRREGMKELLRAAEEWDRLLRDVFPRLEEVCADLQRHQAMLHYTLKGDLEEIDDTLRNADPLGYFDGVPLLDWLDINQDRILIGQALKVFRADIEARAELRELQERRARSLEDVDNYLRGTEPIFDDLEREHGAAVDAILEEDEEDDS